MPTALPFHGATPTRPGTGEKVNTKPHCPQAFHEAQTPSILNLFTQEERRTPLERATRIQDTSRGNTDLTQTIGF